MEIEGKLPIGARIQLPGHFDGPVVLEDARPLHNGYECRVRLADGTLEEAAISKEETALLSSDGQAVCIWPVLRTGSKKTLQLAKRLALGRKGPVLVVTTSWLWIALQESGGG